MKQETTIEGKLMESARQEYLKYYQYLRTMRRGNKPNGVVPCDSKIASAARQTFQARWPTPATVRLE